MMNVGNQTDTLRFIKSDSMDSLWIYILPTWIYLNASSLTLNAVILLSKWIPKSIMYSGFVAKKGYCLWKDSSNVISKFWFDKWKERLPIHCYELQKILYSCIALEYKSFFNRIEPHKIAWVNMADIHRFSCLFLTKE